jgi:phenol hydroxylase P2 protein
VAEKEQAFDGRPSAAMVRLELMAGEQADAVAVAARKLTPLVEVEALPGLVSISAPGRLTVSCKDVSEELGEPWDTRHLQVILANYTGFITQMNEDGVELRWMEDQGPSRNSNSQGGKARHDEG